MKNILTLKKINNKNNLIQNIIALLSSSIIIKILSLLNRIIMTRLLGSYGISLYILAVPTIMLFTSIGGFSLNISIAKFTSSKNVAPNQIIKKGLSIALISSSFAIIILFLFSNFISIKALKQPVINTILISSVFFIFINSINNVFKGYITGINKLKTISISSLLEQLSRFLIVIILLNIYKMYDVIFKVKLCIYSMTIGELISFLFNIYKFNRYKNINNVTELSKTDNKTIISFSYNTTITHLVSNLQLFFEPIIFTLALSIMKISSESILYKYSELNAYVIPTLTLITFISFQISSALFPVFSKKYSENNITYIEKTTNNLIYYLLILGIFSSHIFFYFGDYILNILYDSATGFSTIKIMCYFFIFQYVTPIFNTVLQSTSNDKFILRNQLMICIIKLSLIFMTSLIKPLTNYSLIISTIIIIIINLFTSLLKIKHIIKINIPIIKLLFIFLFMFIVIYVISNLINNFLLAIFMSLIINIIILLFLK